MTITTPVSRIRAAARSCTRVRCCATSRAVIVTSSRSLSTSCRVMKKLPVALRFGATTPSRPTACSFERADDRQPRTNSIRVKKAPMTPNRIIGAIVRRACSHPGCTARERCRWRRCCVCGSRCPSPRPPIVQPPGNAPGCFLAATHYAYIRTIELFAMLAQNLRKPRLCGGMNLRFSK